MSLWRQVTHGLRTLARRGESDREIDEEVQHFLAESAADFEARGLAADEAGRAARREVGNVLAVREEVRSYGWENLLETLLADLRYGARRLRADAGFAVISILTLAIGVGATTAIFSVVNPVLLESLPYPQARRVVTVWDYGRDGSRLDVAFGSYRELAERSRSFDALAVAKPWQPTLTGSTEAERLDGQRVTAGFFHVLGVAPIAGRNFEASDDRVNGPKVAIISDGLWRRRFGAEQAILGQPVVLDGALWTIVGVMPPGFENVMLPKAQIWAPLQYDVTLPLQGREWGHHLELIGRLRQGAELPAARQELDTIARNPLAAFPRPAWASLSAGLIVTSLQDDVTAAVRPALGAVAGAAVLVLAIACVNVANLLLGHGARRRGEFAMRAALGAGRGRLLRQLLTESLLLAAMGGALGTAIAIAAVRGLVALAPAGLPRASAIGLDLTTCVFSLAVTTIIGLAVGMMPARSAARGDLKHALGETSRQTAGGQHLTRRVLVMIEIALALVLLVTAGLLLRSLQQLFAISPGFETSGVLTMQVQASSRFDKQTTDRFFANALDAINRVPGVAAAAVTSQLPLSGEDSQYGVFLESDLDRKVETGSPAFRYAVSPDYFRTLGLPLRRGRMPGPHDLADAPRVAVISESFADTLPGPDPVGRRVYIGPTDRGPFTIVGVVGNVKQLSLAASDTDAIYVTPEQWHFADNAMWVVVRARGDAASLASAVKAAIQSVDRNQPIVRVATLDTLVASTASERQFASRLFELFGMTALVLATIGIYGLVSGNVTERTREIGVRAALGASRSGLLAMVVRQGLALTLGGIAIGLAGAAAASRAIATLLFGISGLDAVTYLAVTGLLVTTSTIACLLPAWRAARVDPALTLRTE